MHFVLILSPSNGIPSKVLVHGSRGLDFSLGLEALELVDAEKNIRKEHGAQLEVLEGARESGTLGYDRA